MFAGFFISETDRGRSTFMCSGRHCLIVIYTFTVRPFWLLFFRPRYDAAAFLLEIDRIAIFLLFASEIILDKIHFCRKIVLKRTKKRREQ